MATVSWRGRIDAPTSIGWKERPLMYPWLGSDKHIFPTLAHKPPRVPPAHPGSALGASGVAKASGAEGHPSPANAPQLSLNQTALVLAKGVTKIASSSQLANDQIEITSKKLQAITFS